MQGKTEAGKSPKPEKNGQPKSVFPIRIDTSDKLIFPLQNVRRKKAPDKMT